MSEKTPETKFQTEMNVSRETIEKLEIYETLLQKWNPIINLVSRNTLHDIWNRHFLDSAQIWKLRPSDSGLWLDLGSGAGFPGLVIAVLAKEIKAPMKVSLVESDVRKAAFLRQASHAMDVSAEIHTARVEDIPPQNASIISARALAPVTKLLTFVELHGADHPIGLFSKGKNHELELTEAKKYWTFDIQKTASLTDIDGVILKTENLGRI
ncbi:MAG: 16S rRNA (guanine527-N7)-methyltransferase [Paracoccaceae bacterium]|jgi:16S rRNA (guanine527-N7)-methyltransferase